MRKREADIVLTDYNIQIEITATKPRPQKDNHKNNPHSEGLHINARICEGFLRVAKRIVPYYILIFNKKWMKFKWVHDLCDLVKPKVIIIPTKFEDGWENNLADKIIKNLAEAGVIK